MLLLKANSALKPIFTRLLHTMGVPVEWDGVFAIENDRVILRGDARSFIFDYEGKRAYADILDVAAEGVEVVEMPEDPLLANIFNMALYAFGKWGLIKGVKVEKDYEEINRLFQNALKEVKVESSFDGRGFRFYQDGKQITYEDVVDVAMRSFQDDGGEAGGEEEGDLGLWHDLLWKLEKHSFAKRPKVEGDAARARIGKNFYMVDYVCPDCKNKLYMTVYPDDANMEIETEEGCVRLARAYACNACGRFYTPTPGRLLAEGQVYSLDFDEDATAYEDYLEHLGEKGTRASSFRVNEYVKTGETEEEREAVEGEAEPEDAATTQEGEAEPEDAMREGEAEPEGAIQEDAATIEGAELEEGVREAEGDSEDGEGEIESEDEAEDIARNQATESETDWEKKEKDNETEREIVDRKVEGAFVGGLHREMKMDEEDGGKADQEWFDQQRRDSKQSEQDAAAAPQEVYKLQGKTIEELKAILARKRAKEEAVAYRMKEGTRSRETVSDPQYIEAVQAHLREKLKAKYDAKVGVIGRMSDGQLTQMKRQVRKEEELTEEDVRGYVSQINDVLHQKEKESISQKVEAATNRTYAEITRLIHELEEEGATEEDEEDGLQAIRREAIEALKRSRVERGRQEVEHLAANAPPLRTREQLESYLERIRRYEDVDTSAYEAQVEEKRDAVEKQEIQLMVKRSAKRNRKEWMGLGERLRTQGFNPKVLSPYLQKIEDKVGEIDRATVEEICPETGELTFSEGVAAYDKIEDAELLPEIKVNALKMLHKRLTRMKTEENRELVRKLRKEMEKKLRDFSRLYFYDVDEMNGRDGWKDERADEREVEGRFGRMDEGDEQEDERDASDSEAKEGEDGDPLAIRYALSGYAAARRAFELPILVCDSSRKGNGKRGFVLTPDRILYRDALNTGSVDITDIRGLEFKKGRVKKDLLVNLKTGEDKKLPNKVRQEEKEAFVEVINEFVGYLQSKPESRSIGYLVKEEHTVKCCYRCGHTYVGGSVCPQCGHKGNS